MQEPGVDASYETVWFCCYRFGPIFAEEICKSRILGYEIEL